MNSTFGGSSSSGSSETFSVKGNVTPAPVDGAKVNPDGAEEPPKENGVLVFAVVVLENGVEELGNGVVVLENGVVLLENCVGGFDPKVKVLVEGSDDPNLKVGLLDIVVSSFFPIVNSEVGSVFEAGAPKLNPPPELSFTLEVFVLNAKGLLSVCLGILSLLSASLLEKSDDLMTIVVSEFLEFSISLKYFS